MIDSAELLIDNVSPSESTTLMSARMALTLVLQMKFAKIQLDHSLAAVLLAGKDRPDAAQIKTNALLGLIPARQPKFAQILRDRTIATPV